MATVRSSDDGFPFCCGVQVLGEARNSRGFGNFGTPSSVEELTTAIKEAMASDSTLGEDYPCFLYTTIPSQVGVRKALKAAGFKVIAEFKNPRSGNNVQLHAYYKPIKRRARTVAARSTRRRVTRRASRSYAR